MGVQYRYDIDQIGLNTDFSRTMNLSQSPNYLYNTFAQIGNVSKLVRKEESRIWLEKDFNLGFNSKITFNYTLGLKHVLDGDFNYHKASISVSHRIRMATFGYSQVLVKAGKVFSEIPYTSLEIPRGNETFFYANNTFNQMNFFEFVSDQYIQAFWQHHFMGLIFNRIPLIKKMNLRETIGANMVYGTLSNKNKSFNSNNVFTVMTDTPYCEASCGIENIFNIIKVDFIYRLTYTDKTYKTNYALANPGNAINDWSIKVGLQFSF